MANTVVTIKRTSVAGRAANTTTLINPGELALNMSDQILYSTNGTVVFEIGANTTNSKVSANLIINSIVANGTLGAAGQVLTSNGTKGYWNTLSQVVIITEAIVDFGSIPKFGKYFDVTVSGATIGQKVVAAPSYSTFTANDTDEYNMDPWVVAASVQATDTVRIFVTPTFHFNRLHGQKKINLIIA